MPSLLVTNDFPPKVGGIQTYLWELWRRLPPEQLTVLTTDHPGASAFDAEVPFEVIRSSRRAFLPTPAMAREIDAAATAAGADVILLDPALPLGALGPRLRSAPYVIVLHGAEVAIPGRLPATRAVLRRVLHGAAGVLAAGRYPLEEAFRCAGRPLRGVVVPPGVDIDRFRPLSARERAEARDRFGLDPCVPVVLGVSRLVPRKGFDVLIEAASMVDGHLQLAVAGAGREAGRLHRLAARRFPGASEQVRFLGRVPDEELAGLYGCADVFAMLCRNRWAGLEQEGFGIVFLEAAACGVPAIAGRSGGSHEAVVHGETGLVVEPRDPAGIAVALGGLLGDTDRRAAMGGAARARTEQAFAYDRLAPLLEPLARGDLSGLELLRPGGEG